MINEQAIIRLMDECSIYFEDALISKERIVRKYTEFFSSAMKGEHHSISVVRHTGSVCFDVMSFLIAVLGCIALNETGTNDILRSFDDGEIIMLSTGNRKERIIWRGLMRKNRDGSFDTILPADFDNADYVCLEQPKQLTKTYLPREQWHRLSPYKGTSTRTDGRGIRKTKSNRNDFISYLFDVPISSLSSVIGVSTVVVTDRSFFKQIVDGVRIEYGDGKSVGLLDLVPASYYTSNLEEYQFGQNPAKTEPNLKITSRVSTARDLVLDKSGNRAVGFMVVGAEDATGGNTELSSLLGRQSLKFSLLSGSVDSISVKEVMDEQPEASLFVCTKEFLLQHASLPKEQNPLTAELEAQISNIINNRVLIENIDGGCSWQDIKAIKEALFAIKRSDIRSDEKDDFIVTAHSLLNVILTGIFTLDQVNTMLEKNRISSRVIAPSKKLADIWTQAEKATEMLEQYLIVADTLNKLYKSLYANCPKREALFRILSNHQNKRIAVVVPKAYYIDVLKADIMVCECDVSIIAANRFNASVQYDVIIVPGDFIGTRFNPLKCRSAADVYVLLYNGEVQLFKYKKKQADIYERKINTKLLLDLDEHEDDELHDDANNGVELLAEEDNELSHYIDSISAFDLNIFASKLSIYSGNAPTSDVYATGVFIGGERILFTRNYQAVVFDEINETVTETNVENLCSGDILVFVKRDGYTKNMVDYIYDQLQQAGRFTSQVIDATEKAQYWKLVLRRYKDSHNLSYRDLAQELRSLGLSIQEVSVRQWLIEESHIVGPREENTLIQIANLTQDPLMLNNSRAYFEACKIVRRQRKRILKLLGKAIVDKLLGRTHTEDKLLELIYENIDSLSEILELESIDISDETISVPTNFTNRPFSDSEVRE